MMLKFYRYLILGIGLTFFLTEEISAQGCSDAGVCTVHSFKPNGLDSISEDLNQIKAGISYGAADYSISVFGTYVEYNRQFNEKFGIDAKVTALSQSGNDISSLSNEILIEELHDDYINFKNDIEHLIGI